MLLVNEVSLGHVVLGPGEYPTTTSKKVCQGQGERVGLPQQMMAIHRNFAPSLLMTSHRTIGVCKLRLFFLPLSVLLFLVLLCHVQDCAMSRSH